MITLKSFLKHTHKSILSSNICPICNTNLAAHNNNTTHFFINSGFFIINFTHDPIAFYPYHNINSSKAYVIKHNSRSYWVDIHLSHLNVESLILFANKISIFQ